MNHHVADLVKGLPNVALVEAPDFDDCRLILMTDNGELAKEALRKGKCLGICLAGYELAQSLSSPKIYFIRKPASDTALLSSIESFLQRGAGNITASAKLVSSRVMGMAPIAEHYPLRILIAEDDSLSQQVRILQDGI
jgi:hypothetical protein